MYIYNKLCHYILFNTYGTCKRKNNKNLWPFLCGTKRARTQRSESPNLIYRLQLRLWACRFLSVPELLKVISLKARALHCFYYIPQLCTGHVISPLVYSSLSFYVVLCFSLQNELQHFSFVVSFSVHSSVLWFALFNDVNLLPAGASAPHAGSGSEGPGDQLGALAEPSLLPTLRQKLWTPGLKGGKSRPKSQL